MQRDMFSEQAVLFRYGGADLKKYVNGCYVETAAQDSKKCKNLPVDYRSKIEELKTELCETDYKCLKFADGALSEDEYAPVRERRKLLRDKINAMQMLAELQGGE